VAGGNLINKTMPIVAEAILGFFLSILELLGDEEDPSQRDPTMSEEAIAQEKEAEALFETRVNALARKVRLLLPLPVCCIA
jgi:hypothetical protein